MTTNANDSGVETSNDSNDTNLLNVQQQYANAASTVAVATTSGVSVSFPRVFDQRSQLRQMLFSEVNNASGNSPTTSTERGGNSNSNSISASNACFQLPLPPPASASASTSSTQTTTLSTFIPQALAAAAAASHQHHLQQQQQTAAQTSSAPTSPSSSSSSVQQTLMPPISTLARSDNSNSPINNMQLCVPVTFLSSYQPTYPGAADELSPHSLSSASIRRASPNAAERRASSSGSSPGRIRSHQHLRNNQVVPYIRNLSNERKLRLAASLSNVEVLLRLLQSGVNPNSCDEYQRSALHLGASRGYTDVVIQLLKFGAKANAQDSLGNTPLHLAVCSASSFNFNRVVRILLKHGASVQVRDRHGKTPLDLVKSKFSLMRMRRANDMAPESIKMLLDMSVLTTLLISTCVREVQSADDINQLEQRLQQLTTSEVETEADALLAKVEQLTLKN